MLFDSVPLEDLRGVHLAGAGLVNRDVLVSGVIEMTGAEGTYLVLSDSSARMLVDTTRVTASRLAKMTSRGKTVLVHGEVKTGEKGHVYLLANAVRGG
jgi:exonuclease VII large subunit